ncbi:XRE family transcriptional regulator [Mesorhizobium sp. NZP2234]|uniref:helix-turn-helix domain-containing protein n=1 Tax=Mesorhizobium sp. NZP2234 TaxID=2483402 RepID=UPI001FED83B1|nr:XRE family transcriptional regulator [Mesorhizobium sp. NZP2234]
MSLISHEIRDEIFTKRAFLPSTTARTLQGPDERVLAGDIRALRRARGLTLAEIALKLGRSVGWVSQVERGLSTPSLSDLRAFAELFGVPISLFFSHDVPVESERGVVVRAGRRRTLGTSETGLVEELLSPDLGGSFEMVRSIFAAGAEMKTEQLRPTEEAGYIASGIFEIEIAGVWHRLGEGDSFRFEGKPYRWRNPGTEPAVIIWVVSPPVY